MFLVAESSLRDKPGETALPRRRLHDRRADTPDGEGVQFHGGHSEREPTNRHVVTTEGLSQLHVNGSVVVVVPDRIRQGALVLYPVFWRGVPSSGTCPTGRRPPDHSNQDGDHPPTRVTRPESKAASYGLSTVVENAGNDDRSNHSSGAGQCGHVTGQRHPLGIGCNRRAAVVWFDVRRDVAVESCEHRGMCSPCWRRLEHTGE